MSTEHKTPNLPSVVLDSTVLRELHRTFGNHRETVASLYAHFLVEAARHINVLRDRSSEARAMTLHTLKGSAAMMGAVRISALAASLLEASLRDPEQPREPAVRQLEEELAMFRHSLARHFGE